MQTYFDIDSIAAVHRFYRCGVPKHPLITVVDLTKVNPDRPKEEVSYRTPLYIVMCKRFEGAMKYGRSYYDFDQGSLMFTAPHQVVSSSADLRVLEGWGLFFHPDLLHGSALGSRMHEYSFFQYDVNEALHIADTEKELLVDCLQKIQNEYSQNFDKHTNSLILDNLQLLLNYCTRFYDRQFLTRSKDNHDVVQKFERMLVGYFLSDSLIDRGLPDVKYFASHLNLSASYLSDLLSRYTGKTTLEHIHLQVVDKARSLLLGSEKTVSEIAYELGFEHPSHFTKIFKAKMGMPPKDFRNLS